MATKVVWAPEVNTGGEAVTVMVNDWLAVFPWTSVMVKVTG